MGDELRAVAKKFDEFSTKIAQLEKGSKALTTSNNELTERIAEVAFENDVLRKRCDALETRCSSLEARNTGIEASLGRSEKSQQNLPPTKRKRIKSSSGPPPPIATISIGHVVWVRLPGFPNWPAVVVNRKEMEPAVELDKGECLAPESPDNRLVQFFNDSRFAVATLKHIREYTANMHLINEAGDAHKEIEVACKEANAFIESKGNQDQKNLLALLQPLKNGQLEHKKSKRRSSSSK